MSKFNFNIDNDFDLDNDTQSLSKSSFNERSKELTRNMQIVNLRSILNVKMFKNILTSHYGLLPNLLSRFQYVLFEYSDHQYNQYGKIKVPALLKSMYSSTYGNTYEIEKALKKSNWTEYETRNAFYKYVLDSNDNQLEKDDDIKDIIGTPLEDAIKYAYDIVKLYYGGNNMSINKFIISPEKSMLYIEFYDMEDYRDKAGTPQEGKSLNNYMFIPYIKNFNIFDFKIVYDNLDGKTNLIKLIEKVAKQKVYSPERAKFFKFENKANALEYHIKPSQYWHESSNMQAQTKEAFLKDIWKLEKNNAYIFFRSLLNNCEYIYKDRYSYEHSSKYDWNQFRYYGDLELYNAYMANDQSLFVAIYASNPSTNWRVTKCEWIVIIVENKKEE